MARKGNSPSKDINNIVKAVVQNADGIRTVVMNTTKGQIARRVFNEGEATDGSSIGSYTAASAEFRVKAGRRTDKVDLELTGTLRRSLVVGVSDGKVVLGMLEQPEPKVSVKGGRLRVTGTSDFNTVDNAIYQEENFGKEIFAPSDSELSRGEKTILKEIDRIVKGVLS